jgi:hypothetical protein
VAVEVAVVMEMRSVWMEILQRPAAANGRVCSERLVGLQKRAAWFIPWMDKGKLDR